MSLRPVIPPSRPVGQSPTTQALAFLQTKLETAEAETLGLVSRLAGLGFPPTAAAAAIAAAGSQSPKTDADGEPSWPSGPVAPFLPAAAEPAVLRRHYEVLVARLCRAESQLQTLKLNLCALRAEKDLGADAAAAAAAAAAVEVATEPRGAAAIAGEADSPEVRRLEAELAKARQECGQAVEARSRAQEEARRLGIKLETATSAKMELAVGYEDLVSVRQKLTKRIAESREELAREGSLRKSLEESHAALLDRVREMEGVVESERLEVQKVSEDCSALREEAARIREEKRHREALLARQQDLTKTAEDKLGEKEIELATIRCEKEDLVTTLKGLESETAELQSKLQEFCSTAESTENQAQVLEEERAALQSVLTQVWSSQQRSGRSQRTPPGSLVAWVTQSLRKLEAERDRLGMQLIKEQSRRESAEHLSCELQKGLRDAEEFYKKEARKKEIQVESLEETMEGLKSQLTASIIDKQDLLKTKEDLVMQEVNTAVDGMSDRTERLHEELTQSKLGVARLGQDKQDLVEENGALMERIASLEQQQGSQQKIQSTIEELLESKNRLAYDKGRLQSRLDRLQEEMEALAGARAGNQQLQKVHAAVQAQCTKVSSELSTAKVTIQRLERQLRQERELSDRKEKDFSLAIQARDEAAQEGQRLKGQLEVMVDREKKREASFQRSLDDAKSDQAAMGATLEGMVASHRHLQAAVENLQTELGRKDSELSTLRSERHGNKKTASNLRREVERLTSSLVSMETADSGQLDSLRSELDLALAEKAKLSVGADDLLQRNGRLQAAAERLQDQLDKRSHKYALLQQARQKDKASLEERLRASEDSLQSVRRQLAEQKDASARHSSKELSQQQRANEDLTTRLKSLSQAEGQLRERTTGLEETCRRQRDRIGSLKSQLESSARLRKTNSEMTEKIKDISHQLSQLEAAKREYARKNSSQAKTIANFVSQVSELQSELLAISTTQAGLSNSSKKNEGAWEKERDRLRKKVTVLQETVSQLREEKREVEDKLSEASNESVLISANIHEAQSWFKAKHDTLQRDLAEARQRQADLERSNAEQRRQLLQERSRAAEQAQRARDMMKASQRALSQLGGRAEVDTPPGRSRTTALARRLQAERDHTARADDKLQKFMDISGQYIEELALELDQQNDGTG